MKEYLNSSLEKRALETKFTIRCEILQLMHCILYCITQVAWLGRQEKITYEPADLIPQYLITEFEAGIKPMDNIMTDSRYGVTSHTLTASVESQEPDPKCAKVTYLDDEG